MGLFTKVITVEEKVTNFYHDYTVTVMKNGSKKIYNLEGYNIQGLVENNYIKGQDIIKTIKYRCPVQYDTGIIRLFIDENLEYHYPIDNVVEVKIITVKENVTLKRRKIVSRF